MRRQRPSVDVPRRELSNDRELMLLSRAAAPPHKGPGWLAPPPRQSEQFCIAAPCTIRKDPIGWGEPVRGRRFPLVALPSASTISSDRWRRSTARFGAARSRVRPQHFMLCTLALRSPAAKPSRSLVTTSRLRWRVLNRARREPAAPNLRRPASETVGPPDLLTTRCLQRIRDILAHKLGPVARRLEASQADTLAKTSPLLVQPTDGAPVRGPVGELLCTAPPARWNNVSTSESARPCRVPAAPYHPPNELNGVDSRPFLRRPPANAATRTPRTHGGGLWR